MKLRHLPVLAAVLCLATGCSWIPWFSEKKPDYQGAQARAAQPLDVPPELSSPTMDDRYSVPDPRTQTTYSAYAKQTSPAAVAAAAAASAPAPSMPANAVLPKLEGVRLERTGSQRWLVVKGEPEKVWPVVREFWIDAGYALLRETPELGLMETDWYEDRSKIPEDLVRRTIGRLIEGLWSYPRRDKFRTRLEKGVEPGTTEIFVSNRNMEEIYTDPMQERIAWQPGKPDSEIEAEMLTRIMTKIAGGETKVTTASAPLPGRRGTTPAAAPVDESRNAVLQNNGSGPLVVNDSFDRAWRRVGLALDRVGFTVEDRDRSKGVFFVRYIDPEADARDTDKRTWLQKLKFWQSGPAKSQPQYRVYVADAGASMSQVQIQDSKGSPESSATGRKILGLLYDQLK
jgi:outer membrane protein assembly factor BamC